MATAIRSASKNNATSGTAITVSAPTGVTEGDVVLIVVNINGTSTTVTDNNGATPFTKDGAIDQWAPPTQSQTNSITIFTRTIQAGDPSTYAFTGGSSQRWGIVAVAISDPNTTSFYDVIPAVANRNEIGNTGDPVDAPSINTNTANAIHIAVGAQDSPSTSVVSGPTGYTKAEEALNQPVSIYYKTIVSAGASGAASSFDWDQNGTKVGFSFAINQSSGATTSTSTTSTSSSTSTSTTSTSTSKSTSTSTTSTSTSKSTSTSTTSTSSSTSTTSTSSSTSKSTSTSTTSTSSSTSTTSTSSSTTNSITTSTSTTSTSSSTSKSTSTSTTSTSTSKSTSTSTTSTSSSTSSSTSTTSTSTSKTTSTSTTSTSSSTSTSTSTTNSLTTSTSTTSTSRSTTSISTSSSTTMTVPYSFSVESSPQEQLENKDEIVSFTVEKLEQIH